MKKIALIAALATAIAAPVAAQSASDRANVGQEVGLAAGYGATALQGNGVTIGTRGGAALERAFTIGNASQDSAIEVHNAAEATLVSGTPSHAAEIFARLAAESEGND
ncbi:hypothetical protein V8J82_00210 [Gymnodinialimonas sp. 2305UL16-5]|uniref:hypothetical protein n=1 Tax=Gymnodinialimonas mytili TaxID=3126503 RepID=UPI0030A88AD2